MERKERKAGFERLNDEHFLSPESLRGCVLARSRRPASPSLPITKLASILSPKHPLSPSPRPVQSQPSTGTVRSPPELHHLRARTSACPASPLPPPRKTALTRQIPKWNFSSLHGEIRSFLICVGALFVLRHRRSEVREEESCRHSSSIQRTSHYSERPQESADSRRRANSRRKRAASGGSCRGCVNTRERTTGAGPCVSAEAAP